MNAFAVDQFYEAARRVYADFLDQALNERIVTGHSLFEANRSCCLCAGHRFVMKVRAGLGTKDIKRSQ